MSPLHVNGLLLFASLAVAGCARLPRNVAKPESRAVAPSKGTPLARFHEAAVRSHPGKSGMHLIAEGLDAFVARAALADAATRTIDAQYYLVHDDLTGSLFIHQLIKAANRGVRVRLLVDDIDLGGRDVAGTVLDHHPNVEVRVFNPFSRHAGRTLQLLTRFGSVTRRMHNKSFTVDNCTSILGGRNIGDEYFGANPDLAFGDLDAVVIGKAVPEVSASFDRYWNSASAYPISALRGRPSTETEVLEQRKVLAARLAQPDAAKYVAAMRDSTLARQIRSGTVKFHWGEAAVIADQPEKVQSSREETRLLMTPILRPYFEATRRELHIISPYFVPAKDGTEFLCGMARRGVRVRIVTNSLVATDVPVVHAGYRKYRESLLRAGIELHELDQQFSPDTAWVSQWLRGSSKASLHAKSFVFDRKRAFVGSFNFCPRSIAENTEIGVVFESPEIAGRIAERFDEDIEKLTFRLELVKGAAGRESLRWHRTENGRTIIFDSEPRVGMFKRAAVRILGVLPIESQL